MADRGAHRELTFMRCERGFLLRVVDLQRIGGEIFAFDRIEDVGAWLVEQYRDPPADYPTQGTN